MRASLGGNGTQAPEIHVSRRISILYVSAFRGEIGAALPRETTQATDSGEILLVLFPDQRARKSGLSETRSPLAMHRISRSFSATERLARKWITLRFYQHHGF